MRRLVFVFTLILNVPSLFGQTCVKEEKTIRYLNGYEVFNICKVNPAIAFDERKSYYWYNEYSKVKFSKGGVGGNLLNGNYKYFDKDGNLVIDKNFLLGIEHGTMTIWDSLGNITNRATYDHGELTYLKVIENNEWVEVTGKATEPGTRIKKFNDDGVLLYEARILEDLSRHVKTYYESPSGQLKEEFFNTGRSEENRKGKYTSYHKNGAVRVEGHYFEGFYTNIQIGTWSWHNEDGTLDFEEEFKAEETYWENGKLKSVGGYKFDTESRQWLKTGNWYDCDETGSIIKITKFELGVEVSK
jgi:antitoxin component YwqK of YwqJK toxin-antitoxin module